MCSFRYVSFTRSLVLLPLIFAYKRSEKARNTDINDEFEFTCPPTATILLWLTSYRKLRLKCLFTGY